MASTQGPGRRASAIGERPHPGVGAQRRGGAGSRDCGLSLVELLVAVVLLGTAGVAVLGGIAATARGSGVHHSLSQAQAWLSSAADELSGGAVPFVECASPQPLDLYEQGSVFSGARSDGVDLRVESIAFWDGTSWISSCPADHSAPQRIDLRVERGDQIRRIVVVKHQQPAADQATMACRPGRTCPLEPDTIHIEPTPGFGP